MAGEEAVGGISDFLGLGCDFRGGCTNAKWEALASTLADSRSFMAAALSMIGAGFVGAGTSMEG